MALATTGFVNCCGANIIYGFEFTGKSTTRFRVKGNPQRGTWTTRKAAEDAYRPPFNEARIEKVYSSPGYIKAYGLDPEEFKKRWKLTNSRIPKMVNGKYSPTLGRLFGCFVEELTEEEIKTADEGRKRWVESVEEFEMEVKANVKSLISNAVGMQVCIVTEAQQAGNIEALEAEGFEMVKKFTNPNHNGDQLLFLYARETDRSKQLRERLEASREKKKVS